MVLVVARARPDGQTTRASSRAASRNRILSSPDSLKSSCLQVPCHSTAARPSVATMACLQRARACQRPAGGVRPNFSDLRICSSTTLKPAASLSQAVWPALGLISAQEALLQSLRGRKRLFEAARTRSGCAVLLHDLAQITLRYVAACGLIKTYLREFICNVRVQYSLVCRPI